MKNIKVFRFLIFFIFILIGCNTPQTKEEYIKEYKIFIEKIEKNSSSYTTEEWDRVTKEYEKFNHIWYDKFSKELTFNDKLIVLKNSTIFNMYKSISKIKSKSNNLDEDKLKIIVDSLRAKLEYYKNNNMKDDINKMKKQVEELGEDVKELFDDLFEK